MQYQNDDNKIFLSHHEQQSLCTTRRPYRQGRKLTAVKVYSISKESNHLLIFGVPSLNLRQETKALFLKFGKLLQFNISKDHAAETFTETYHAQYERIQSARYAKRMIDTKNFYGGSLHICYAPEFENINETKQKLMQRQHDVIFRLKNVNNKEKIPVSTTETDKLFVTGLINECDKQIKDKIIDTCVTDSIKLNMGEFNTISIGNNVKKVSKKRKLNEHQKFLPCFTESKRRTSQEKVINTTNNLEISSNNAAVKCNMMCSSITVGEKKQSYIKDINNIEIVDCTGIEDDVITNINEHLNYNNFGNEIVRKVPQKPVNKIQFHLNKNS